MGLYSAFFILDVFLFIFAPSSMNKTFMSFCALLALSKVVIYLRTKPSRENDVSNILLRHSVVFLFSFLIVFFQCDVDYVLGFADETDYFVYNPSVVCKAMTLSNMAISCFLIGYSAYKLKQKKYYHIPTLEGGHNCFIKGERFLIVLSFVMLALFIVFVPRDYLSNGYANNIEGGSVVMITGYLVAVFIAIFVIGSLNNYFSDNAWFKKFRIPLIIIALYSFVVILTGRRTEVVRVALIALCSYVYVHRDKVKNKLIIFLGAVSGILLSIIGIVRTLVGGTLVEGYSQLRDVISIFPPTKEFANSVVTLHIAMSYFPQEQFYNLGVSFIPQFLKIIPGFTGVLQLLTGIRFRGSEDIVTELYFGSDDATYGLGSSVVSDVYISFGILGVCVVFFFLGRFIRWLEVETFCKSPSPYFLALSFSCYSQTLYVCRQGVGMFFLCWAYSCLLIFFLSHLPKKKISNTT